MSDFRDKLGRDLDAEYELVRDFLKDAMTSTRKVWHTCPNPDCKKRSEVEIPDVKAGLQAAQLWIDQGFGKAAQSQAKPPEPLDPEDTDVTAWTPEKRAHKKAQLLARLRQQPDSQKLDLSVD